MCGQAGIIFGKKRRRIAERDHLINIFYEMMYGIKARGPHATGVCLVKADGTHHLCKAAMPAHRFFGDKPVFELLENFDNEATMLLGHTRWATRGNPDNRRNNHPLVCGEVVGTHNGTIYNAGALFTRSGMRRGAEVDSEYLVRAADESRNQGGRIIIKDFKEYLRPCQGQMSAALVSKADPTRPVLLKGNKPLCLRYHKKMRVVIYASSVEALEQATYGEDGWTTMQFPTGRIYKFNHEDINDLIVRHFTFTRLTLRGTLPAGVTA